MLAGGPLLDWPPHAVPWGTWRRDRPQRLMETLLPSVGRKRKRKRRKRSRSSPGWSAPMERRLLAACGPRTFLRRWAGGRTIVLFHCRFCPAAPRRYES
ncbi:unnamed protein product [Prorocentrum cordatum]|uniref:Uncharacterized protein n=1 Tax=Prorocentrum cordatum TaxID=2364126 RepID=A0ABN9WZ79_9DINO|nr:unnamed protein product [Polarella glacialis]